MWMYIPVCFCVRATVAVLTVCAVVLWWGVTEARFDGTCHRLGPRPSRDCDQIPHHTPGKKAASALIHMYFSLSRRLYSGLFWYLLPHRRSCQEIVKLLYRQVKVSHPQWRVRIWFQIHIPACCLASGARIYLFYPAVVLLKKNGLWLNEHKLFLSIISPLTPLSAGIW